MYYIIIQTVTLSGGSNKLLQGTTVLTTDSGEKLVMDGEKVIGKLKLLPSSDRSNSSASGKVSDTTFWVLLDLYIFQLLVFLCVKPQTKNEVKLAHFQMSYLQAENKIIS